MNDDFQMEHILTQYIRLISRTHENINNTIRTMEDQINDLSRMMFEYLNQRRNNRQESIGQNIRTPSRPAEPRRSVPLRTTSFFSDPAPSETNQSTSNSLLNPPRAAPIIPPPPPPPPIFQFRAGASSTINNEITSNSTINTSSNTTSNTTSTTNNSIFNRGITSRRSTRNVSTSPIRRNNILTTPLISTRRSIARRRNARRNLITSLPGILSGEESNVGQDILTATMNDSPVRVRPSRSQIRRATRLTVFRNITHEEGTICPIDREILNDDDNVLQIVHCGHYFREENLRRHFTMSTRCPLCRFDIRDYIENYSEPRDSTSFFSSRNRTPSLPPIDIENPFSRRSGVNFNPTQQTTDELQAISNALNSLDNSGNIISVEYTFSLASLDNNTNNNSTETNNNSTETDDTEIDREHFD